MTDILNAYFKRHYPAPLFPRIVCKDGFSFSAQGGANVYSRPRDFFAEEYLAVEVGFPSACEDLLMPYIEDAARPTETVYAYVPVAVVIEVIKKHGGIE